MNNSLPVNDVRVDCSSNLNKMPAWYTTKKEADRTVHVEIGGFGLWIRPPKTRK